MAAELEDRDYYREVNVFWVPEAARWEAIRAAAKQPDIGKRIDDALSSSKPRTPSSRASSTSALPAPSCPTASWASWSTWCPPSASVHRPAEARDVLGQVYEYFLGMFASAEGKRGGQFYTPRSIVKTLVAVLAPHHGKVYDPCCGSGGMFVQSEEFILSHGGKIGDVAIFGQEANPTTWRLAAMNLAIRGIDFNLGREPADTFTRDQFPDLRADFILANPPFNISDWWHASLIRRRALGLRRPAAGQRQLRLAAAHAAPPEARRPRRHRAGQRQHEQQPEQRRPDPRGDGRGRRGGSDDRAAGAVVLQHADSGLPVVPGQGQARAGRRGAVHRRAQAGGDDQPGAVRADQDEVIDRIAGTVAAWRGEPARASTPMWRATAAA
jgi:hypothetical protein